MKVRQRKTGTEKMVAAVKEAQALMDPAEAAMRIENQSEAGAIAKAVAETWRLLYGSLVAERKLKNDEYNQATFAKAQMVCLGLVQTAFACGMRAGEAHSELSQELADMGRPRE